MCTENVHTAMKTVDTDGVLTREKAREVLESRKVNEWGRQARQRSRGVSGNRVYYGDLCSPEDVTEDGYSEVLLAHREDIEEGSVDVFIGAPDDGIDEHRRVHSLGVRTDVSVVYGDGGLVERLAEVRELASEGSLRGVTLHPAEGRPVTTAYTDLKAVAVTRLFLPTEDVPLVRVARNKVGDKLTQTGLEYGANDLGFIGDGDEDDEDLALIGREAGFEPVERREEFGGDG